MNKENGGPAFPHEYKYGDGTAAREDGMTLRDYFAAKALAGILPALAQGIRPQDIQNMAQDCYGIADAMLVERAK